MKASIESVNNIFNQNPSLCREDIKTINGKQFQSFVNERGGIAFFSQKCGYSIRSFERMYKYDGFTESKDLEEDVQVIPECIKRIMILILEKEAQGAELTRAKYDLKRLKARVKK